MKKNINNKIMIYVVEIYKDKTHVDYCIAHLMQFSYIQKFLIIFKLFYVIAPLLTLEVHLIHPYLLSLT